MIQIISKGTFRDPELGLSNGSGAGSGFIISPDGLAVTNNHVVAGAATLEIYIGGDSTHSYNARIIGVSECNDLALIDINESEPLPYLDWYTGDVTPGTDVYTAGFPLGDPEYTLTRGIVSKARANGESDWASLDYVIEHDATIQGGNSGGPLVTDDGKVLGINYASSQGTNSSIYYAVPGAIAQNVIGKLKNGNFESIGVNGWAVQDSTLNVSGIWVAGVAAGSPASDAGIQAGDIITSLNGLPMGTDGTMADYCDVFRTNGADKPMTVEVYRYDTGEILRGEVNSDKPIEVVFSPAAQIQQDTNAQTSNNGTTYSGYYSITDDLNQIIVDVPNEWDDVGHAPLHSMTSATFPALRGHRVNGFRNNSWAHPAWIFAFYGQADVVDLLDRVTSDWLRVLRHPSNTLIRSSAASMMFTRTVADQGTLSGRPRRSTGGRHYTALIIVTIVIQARLGCPGPAVRDLQRAAVSPSGLVSEAASRPTKRRRAVISALPLCLSDI